MRLKEDSGNPHEWEPNSAEDYDTQLESYQKWLDSLQARTPLLPYMDV